MAGRVDLNHLERLARGATPGLWLPGDGERVPSDVVSAPSATRDGFDDEDYAHYGGALIAESMRPADREYIAAADPATVLTLVAELSAARRVVEAARVLVYQPHESTAEETAEVIAIYDQATGQPATADQPPGAR